MNTAVTSEIMDVEACYFQDDGETVNNSRFPLLLIRGTQAANASDPAGWFERTFATNGWGGSWRWGVYPFHHFHTNTHEVLGVARGEAELLMGGAQGTRFTVRVGDVVVIPAGVGHKCERCSDDFLVVGAYPDAASPDLHRSGEEGTAGVHHSVEEVGLPAGDPVSGAGGALFEHWK